MTSLRTPILSNAQNDEKPPVPFYKFQAVILLSLPVIVGTGFFLTSAILTNTSFNDAPAAITGELTAGESAKLNVAVALFFTCYFGATLGPLLLPLAGYQAITLTRAVGWRSRVAISAWVFVVLGLIAAALFWGWLINLDLYI